MQYQNSFIGQIDNRYLNFLNSFYKLETNICNSAVKSNDCLRKRWYESIKKLSKKQFIFLNTVTLENIPNFPHCYQSKLSQVDIQLVFLQFLPASYVRRLRAAKDSDVTGPAVCDVKRFHLTWLHPPTNGRTPSHLHQKMARCLEPRLGEGTGSHRHRKQCTFYLNIVKQIVPLR